MKKEGNPAQLYDKFRMQGGVRVIKKNTDFIGKVASSALSGGVGKAVDRATQLAAGAQISNLAERTAAAYKRRGSNKKTPAEIKSQAKEQTPREKKLSGVGFWMILSLCIGKDLLDIFTNLSVILSVVVWISTMAILFIVNFYLFYIGIKPTTKKVFWQAATFLADAIPFISIFVGYTLYLIFLRIVENNEFGAITKKITSLKSGGEKNGRLKILHRAGSQNTSSQPFDGIATPTTL